MPETDEPGDHDAVIVACIQALDEFVNRSRASTRIWIRILGRRPYFIRIKQ
jgi:hypothetical protein